MHKKKLVIGIIIVVIIVIITIYIITTNSSANENNITTHLENNISTENNNEVNNDMSNLNSDENSKYLESLQDIPTPDSITFYHNGVQKTFVKGSDEFNKISMLNNRRDGGNLGAMKLVVFIDELLKNTEMLEYNYKNYKSVYFNLIKDEELKNDNKKVNWVSVGYAPKVFNQFTYSGLLSADDLINYLYSLK